MKAENHTDNFYEHNQHREHLSRISHVEEDAEDIDGQQRQNDRPDSAHHDFLEVVHHVLQCRSVEARQSDADGKRQEQGRHHVHQRWDGDGEKRFDIVVLAHFLKRYACRNHAGKQCGSGEIRQKSREQGCAIGDKRGDEQHFSCRTADVGNGRNNQSHYDKRNDESEKFVEKSVECGKDSYSPVGHISSKHDAQQDGNQNARQQSDAMFFQRYKIPEIHKYGNFLCMDAKLRFPFCFASVEKVFEVYFK